jgi:uncharacterized protein (DUF1501 family)
MTLTRRTFLASPFLAGAARLLAAQPDRDGAILVVLQLAGGNDGLNTVVPYEDDHYAGARTTLRLTGNQVHKLGSSSNELLGFHPELSGFARLYQEGHLSVIQGVGYPDMHRDHNAGMLSWQTASPAPREQTGWLGRVADRCADPDQGNVPAAFVGRIPAPLAIHGRETIVPTIRETKDWTFTNSFDPPLDVPRPNTLLKVAARSTAGAYTAAQHAAAVLKSAKGLPYPDLPLAQSFQTVAQLIRANLGLRIFLVEQGGVSPGEFDNHANQAVNHAVSLRELSRSVTAFCDDLAHDHLLDRVLVMTFSEFGRTVTENGRHGTGHGAAAPVFLAGGCLKGGLVGKHPSLADLDADALKPHTDFRTVYTTVLETWLRIPAAPILGPGFAPLDILDVT